MAEPSGGGHLPEEVGGRLGRWGGHGSAEPGMSLPPAGAAFVPLWSRGVRWAPRGLRAAVGRGASAGLAAHRPQGRVLRKVD